MDELTVIAVAAEDIAFPIAAAWRSPCIVPAASVWDSDPGGDGEGFVRCAAFCRRKNCEMEEEEEDGGETGLMLFRICFAREGKEGRETKGGP